MGRFEVRSRLGASTRAPTRGAPTEVGAGARNRPFWIHEGPRRATENTFLIREGSLRDAKNTFLSTMGRFEVRSKLGASTRAPTRGAPTEVGAGARNRPFWIHEGPRRATENTFLIREGSLRDAKNTFLSTMGRFEVRSRLGASTRAPTRGAPTEVGAGARNRPFWIHEGPRRATENTFLIREGSLIQNTFRRLGASTRAPSRAPLPKLAQGLEIGGSTKGFFLSAKGR